MINYYLYRFGQSIALSLPLKAVYCLAIFLSEAYQLFAWRDCRLVSGNLKVIFPQKTSGELKTIRRRVFHNFAKYLVDFFRFQKLDRRFIAENIKLENLHYFDQALAKGKGVVVLTAHLGNWELGGVVIAQLGYPFWAVALSHKNKKVDEFFVRQRSDKGVKVIPLGRAVRDCITQLKKNNMVALVGDRDFNQKGILTEIFGKSVRFPEGPAALSLMTGACIVPGFMLRNSDDSFTLRIEKPIEPVSSGDKLADMHGLVSAYRDIFEKYIREYPEQWYLFRKFWVD